MIGTALRAVRTARGLTQKEVADKVGTTQPQYSAWEAGKHEPRGATVGLLCKALGISESELLGARLEGDADLVWLGRQLHVDDKIVVMEVMAALVRRRAGVSVDVAVVRPAADVVAVVPGPVVEVGGVVAEKAEESF
jgi:transcriptional regulator with XRE-family HTH domain